MTTMWSERRGHELYVYWRGVLIYKRWANEYSVVFDSIGLPWFTDHRDRQ